MSKQFLGNIKGKSLEFNWKKTELGIRKEGDTSYEYTDLKGPRGEVGPAGQRGKNGVGVVDITQRQEEDTVTLRFEMSDNSNKEIQFIATNGGSSPLQVKFEEIFNGNSKDLVFTKPLGNYQLLQIQDSRQTVTVPAKVGVEFRFWYSSGEIQQDKVVMSSSGSFKIYGIKLRGQVSASAIETNLEDYLKNNESGTLNGNLEVTGDIDCKGTVYGLSDKRLKKNIKTIENSLDKISKIHGVTFNWCENDKKSAGLIAQEVESVLPEAVKTHGYKVLNYNAVIGLCIEAIKQLQRELEVLKNATK